MREYCTSFCIAFDNIKQSKIYIGENRRNRENIMGSGFPHFPEKALIAIVPTFREWWLWPWNMRTYPPRFRGPWVLPVQTGAGRGSGNFRQSPLSAPCPALQFIPKPCRRADRRNQKEPPKGRLLSFQAFEKCVGLSPARPSQPRLRNPLSLSRCLRRPACGQSPRWWRRLLLRLSRR